VIRRLFHRGILDKEEMESLLEKVCDNTKEINLTEYMQSKGMCGII
jgi:hypothetical protein